MSGNDFCGSLVLVLTMAAGEVCIPDPGPPGGLEELDAREQTDSRLDSLGHPCVVRAMRALQASSAPAILLDLSLRIAWTNPAFEGSFGTRTGASGRNLALFFADSFDEERRNGLFRSLRSPGGGHSWYGGVEKRIQGQLSFTGNLTVLPLFADGDSPVGFQGILSDTSAEHREMLRSTYLSLLQAARLKDNDTGNHIERVNRYSRRLAEELLGDPAYPEVDVDFVENIAFLAAMHDVGKIGTPDDILNKAGKLEPWEWKLMKEHTINGAYILASYPNPMARDIALRHHERWDGKGYPHGVSEDLIPLSARIVAIADVYDALRMKRSYKPAMEHEKAATRILREKGAQFDPFLVECFQRLEGEFRSIYEELAEEPDHGRRRGGRAAG